jgi:hypothetical protein
MLRGRQDINVPSSFAFSVRDTLILDVIRDHLLSVPLSFKHSKVFDEVYFLLHVSHILDGLVVFGHPVFLLVSGDLLGELIRGCDGYHKHFTVVLIRDHT